MSLQRIRSFLYAIGDEVLWRRFFADCFRLLLRGSFSGNSRSEQILIDSTGLLNSVHFQLTAVSSHSGDISNEVYLIYDVQQKTGQPIYLRYVLGNVLDAENRSEDLSLD